MQANIIRKDILEMIYNIKSGHLGGSFSMVEILTALYFDEMIITQKIRHLQNGTVLSSQRDTLPPRFMPHLQMQDISQKKNSYLPSEGLIPCCRDIPT